MNTNIILNEKKNVYMCYSVPVCYSYPSVIKDINVS